MISWYGSSSFKKIPWKNGGGETLELFKIEDPHHSGQFLFRLSIAKIDKSGPFSSFPGVDRLLLLLSGPGITLLKENGERYFLSPMQNPHEFNGEEAIQSIVSEACVDFNVMIKRNWGSAKLAIQEAKTGEKFKLYSGQYLYQLSGQLKTSDTIKDEQTLWEVKNEIEVESLSDSTSIIITISKNNKHRA